MPVSINVQADQAALAKSIAQGVAQFNSGLAGKNQLKLKIDGRSFSQPLGRITDDLNNFESAMKASNARVLAFGASTAVLGGLVKVFKDIADATVEVEKGIADINRILNLSLGGLQKFSSELFDVARSTAVSFDQASKAALEFSRQGLATEEVLRRTSDALTLVRLTGIDAGKAVSDLTAAVNGFAREGLTTSEVLNKVVAVEQKFAVSARDITEALSRAGQSALEAGADFNQLNALVATAQQTTARGGSVIGNALKTIFTRLQRGGTLDQLEKFNVQVRDIEGNILPSVQILQNFAKVYDTLGKAQKAYLSEQVAGVYQVNILKALVNDLSNEYGVYNQALMVAANATNEANVANEKLNQTLSSIITQTGTSIKQLGSTIGTLTFEPLGKQLLSALNTALKFINDTIEGDGDSLGSNFARGLLEGFKTLLVPGLIAVFKLVGQVAARTLKDLSQAIPAVMGITTQSQKRQQLEKSILTILQGQGDVSKALQGLGNDRSAQAKILLGIAKNTTAEYQKQVSLAKSLSSTLASSGVSVGSRGLQTGKRIKAGGFIPAQDQNAEMMGALMGGYSPGKVVKSPVGGVMNTAEDVKYVAGFSQPFINPPASSKAGKTHRSNSIAQTGVDPYASLGFIPNFFPARKITKFPGETEEAFKARVNEQKKGRTKKKTGKIVTLDTKGQIGLLSLFSEGPRGTTNEGVASVKAESLSGAIRNSPTYKKLVGANYNGQISLKNIQLRALDNISDLSGGVKSGDFSNFTKRIDEELLTATSRIISKSPLARVFPNPKISATEIKNNLAKDKIWDDIFPAPVQGSMFEYAIRAGTKTSKEFAASVAGDKNAAFDFEESGGASSDFKNLFGFSASKVDGKRTSSLDAVNSLVRKSFNSGVASKFTKLSSLGFIPNFASKKSSKDSVMSLEEKLSGEKAMFYNEPFPHVRNASQPSFSKAMSDHGGMIQALKDSYAMQSQTGIISNGFIPNFAIPTIPGLKSMDVFGKKFQALTKLQQQQMQNLNSALQKLATSTNLTADQQRLLVNDVRTNAKALEANTGSTIVVTKANQALSTAKAAQTAATQAATTATKASAAVTGVPTVGALAPSFSSPQFIGPTTPTQKNFPTFSRGASYVKSGFRGGMGGAGLIGASLAAPMLGGQISSSITRGRDRSELTYGERLASSSATGVTSGAITGALIGSSILPGWGTAIGAAVGGLAGFASALSQAATTLSDLRTVAEKRTEEEVRILNMLSEIEALGQAQPNETREQAVERIRKREALITDLPSNATAQLRRASVTGGTEAEAESLQALKAKQIKATEISNLRERVDGLKLEGQLTDEARTVALRDLVRIGEQDELVKKNIDAVIATRGNVESLNDYLKSTDFENLPKDFQEIFKNVAGVVKSKPPRGMDRKTKEEREAAKLGVTPGFKQNIQQLTRARQEQERENKRVKEAEGKIEEGPSLEDLTNKINTYLIKLQGETQRALEQASISQKLGRINETFNQTLLSNVQSPIEIFKRNSNFLKGELEAAIKVNQKEIRSAFIGNISGIANKITDPKTKEKVVELLTGGDSVDSIISQLEELTNVGKGIKLFTDPGDVEAFKNALEREKENQLTQQTINQGKRDILSQETQVNLQRLTIVEKERENIVQAALANAQRERFLQAEASNVRMRQADRAAMLNTPQAQNLGIGARADLENQIAAQNAAENIRLQKASQLSEIGRGQLGGETEFSRMREGLQQKVNEKAGDVEVLSQEEQNKYASELQSIEELKDAEIALNEYRKTASEENLQKVIETREAVIKTIEEREGETTKVRELKTEVENLKRAQDEIKQGEKEINAELERQRQLRKAQVESRTTAKGGFERAKGRIQQELDEFPATFTENTTMAFRDGLVDAMKSAADGTKSIKDGLLDAASSFLGKMNDMLMQNIANQMMGGIMGGLGGMFGGGGMGGGMGGAMGGGASTMMFKRGGFIRAQNGMYISGGRIGDKNPALLEDGEYVLNRNAVKGMGGPSAIDALNFGMMPRFAENAGLTSGISAKVPGFEGGGKVTSARIKETGEARLSKTVDLMDPKGGGNFDASATVNLAADSDRLSAFALDNDVYIKRYMKQQQEIQARRDAKRRAKKEKRKALIRQAITTAIMMGVSAGVGAIGTGAGGATSTSGGALGGGVTKQTFSGLQTKNPFSNTVTSQNLSADIFSGGFGVAQRGGLIKANKGGYIPYGNRLTDSIPAMLAGGEYIVNSKAVRKYGVGGLNKVNAGLARFQEGGLVGGGMDAGPIESDSSSSSTNNISVNITVNNQSSTGKSSEEKSEDSGVGSKESESEKAFNLSQKIKSVVLEVLNKEQRAGGMLSSTKGKS